MITCIVCGKPVKAGSGAVYAILDGFVGVCTKPCHPVLASRLSRLIDGIAHEFSVERQLLEAGEESETRAIRVGDTAT
jgi:hypothetical protein